MRTPKSAFDNKFHYDAGRMRYSIAVMNYSVTDDGSGGTSLTEQIVYSTKAGKEGVSEYTQNSVNASRNSDGGITGYTELIYFVVRNRKNIRPDKTMHINFGSDRYTIIKVQEMDSPCTFLKILCGVIT